MSLLKAILVAFIASSAIAQTTSVTATITDSDGQLWSNGTWNAQLISPKGPTTGPSGAVYTISNPQSAQTVTIQGGSASQPINGLTTAITIPNNSTVTLRDIANPKATSGCHWAM